MLGKGHMGTGIAAASYLPYVVEDPFKMILLASSMIVGSVFPDRAETLGPIRFFSHRGFTHWLLLWVALLLGGAAAYNLTNEDLYFLLIGLSIGSIIHILGDIPNYQKIPILSPKPSFSLGLWKSGQNDMLIVFILFLPHLVLLNSGFEESFHNILIDFKNIITMRA